MRYGRWDKAIINEKPAGTSAAFRPRISRGSVILRSNRTISRLSTTWSRACAGLDRGKTKRHYLKPPLRPAFGVACLCGNYGDKDFLSKAGAGVKNCYLMLTSIADSMQALLKFFLYDKKATAPDFQKHMAFALQSFVNVICSF